MTSKAGPRLILLGLIAGIAAAVAAGRRKLPPTRM